VNTLWWPATAGSRAKQYQCNIVLLYIHANDTIYTQVMSKSRKEDAVPFKSTCYVAKLTAPFSTAVLIPNTKKQATKHHSKPYVSCQQ